MPDYRRAFLNGGTFFFTVVTYKRYPVFKEEEPINLLRNCFRSVSDIRPFKIEAIVVLPDHIHSIWTLPDNESDFSTRWKLIKCAFSRNYCGPKAKIESKSIVNRGEKGIWQRRFWEHAIRDQDDFNRHCDYIHYNPVKHRLANSPLEWEYSSFRNLVNKGFYTEDWGQQVQKDLMEMNLE